MDNKCVYLDQNGTTPIYEEVQLSMIPQLTNHFGNPSSTHFFGIQPKNAISNSRNQIAKAFISENNQTIDKYHEKLQMISKNIVFTGCGTESDNLAIQLAIKSFQKNTTNSNNINTKPHIITSNAEHPAITEQLKQLENINEVQVTWVEVNEFGIISADDIVKNFQKNTILVTVIYAQNEIGSLNPIKSISNMCHEHNILFHTDAAQAVGKVSIDFEDMGFPDMVTIVGHKFGAPKGIAALQIADGSFANWPGGLLQGGGQENGRRAGTENVPQIVAIGKAMSMLHDGQWQINSNRYEELRKYMISKFNEQFESGDFIINGPIEKEQRLPNTLNLSIKGINSSVLLSRIGERVAISAGSACHSNVTSISPILCAMNVDKNYIQGTLRLSVGLYTTEKEIDYAILQIFNVVRELKIHTK